MVRFKGKVLVSVSGFAVHQSDGRLAFLDVQLSRNDDGTVCTSVYRKDRFVDDPAGEVKGQVKGLDSGTYTL